MSDVSRRESAAAWQLRGAWITGNVVVLTLEPGPGITAPRVTGYVEHVAPSDSHVIIKDPVSGLPWHVPCAAVSNVRRPHYHEPEDAPWVGFAPRMKPRPEPIPGQLAWDFQDQLEIELEVGG